MKLYYAPMAPNPDRVRFFLQEKGIWDQTPKTELNIIKQDHRQPAYLAKNPGGQTPALELDDGSVIGETVVICEYIEEAHPTPALVGRNAQERAVARQWQRRIELNITEYIYNAFRYAEGYGLFKDRVHCIPVAAPEMKVSAQNWLKKLDGLMAGRQFVAGNELRLVDSFRRMTPEQRRDLGNLPNVNWRDQIALFERNYEKWNGTADGRLRTILGPSGKRPAYITERVAKTWELGAGWAKHVTVEVALASPKSAIFTRPDRSSRRFSGLMSRWTMPRSWANCSASHTGGMMASACSGISFPSRSRSRRFTPSMNSMTR